ncbi:MAG TPA: ABC transporter permease [Candidatus Acidoferrum sp.]|nr:ABC transporter permease [Candidatus Acidoferrum sp.]
MTTLVTLHMSPTLSAKVKQWLRMLLQEVAIPLLGIGCFLLVWAIAANRIDTSLGKFPGPAAAYEQAHNLWNEYREEKQKEKEFYARQAERNAQHLAEDPNFVAKVRPYTGKPTFPSQVVTSLVTVLSGFALALLVGLPTGIAIGLNRMLNSAFNPVIQIFKPVSPLAWLPLVTLVVSSVYTSENPTFSKSYINSLLTVALCSLWPIVINTAVGVASIPQDWVNVSRVLRLGWFTHVRKLVLPAAVPAIFTGMRLALGVAWMVLIAAEMLAQNPGLGKFVWDEFQNGSTNSLGRIMVAVLAIGLIGFLLDRSMLQLQRWLSWDKASASR